jgi:DNA polymerase-3 subunit epsilon/CBS domain-containing protein
MSAPAVTVPAAARLSEVLALLIERRISSVFVEPTPEVPTWGILTERDLLRAVHARPRDGLGRTAGEAASRPLETVPADAFLYSALAHMARRNFRHLAVADPKGAIVGALTSRNLLGQRAQDAIALGAAIEEAATPKELGRVWARLALVAKGLVGEEVDPRDVAAVISRELCALTRRAAEIAERDMGREGLGPAPVPYALLVLGSAGRGESLLAMDQDNAIVYAAGEAGGPEDRWMAELGRRVADHLDAAGVPYCKGGVMAKNPEWRMSEARWRTHVGRWISRSEPGDILNSDIFFDAVTVHGDRDMGEALRRDAMAAAASSRNFLKLMAINAAEADVPLGWFGRFRLSGGRMDLKKGGILPIFSAARVLALTNAIPARSTPERLEAARGRKGVPDALIDNLIEAHRILLGAILHQQLVDIELGVPLSNRVAPSDLAASGRERLQWALEQVRSVGALLGDPLHVG